MKKLLFGLLIVGATFAAQAEFLYWQVTQETINSSEYLKTTLDAGSTYFGQLRFGTGADYGAYGVYDEAISMIPGDGVKVDLGVLKGDPTANAYYIEILKSEDGDFKGVAKSEVWSYSELSTAGFINSALNVPSLKAWTGGVGYTVPEPTSALMMLMGIAFLGLKRRKV